MGPQLVSLGTCRHPKAPTVYPFGVLTEILYKVTFLFFGGFQRSLKPTTKSHEWHHIFQTKVTLKGPSGYL